MYVIQEECNNNLLIIDVIDLNQFSFETVDTCPENTAVFKECFV